MAKRTHYQVLEVTNRASLREIKQNYYKLSKIHHPDLNGDQDKFLELGEAYQCLMDKNKRRDYDATLGINSASNTQSAAQGYSSSFRQSRARRNLNPDDYILYRKSRPSKLYDYDTHSAQHYPREQKRGDRLSKSLYYQNIYRNHTVQSRMFMWGTAVGLAIFLFASGWVEMIVK
jgi:DnaJ-class molecular chaperone